MAKIKEISDTERLDFLQQNMFDVIFRESSNIDDADIRIDIVASFTEESNKRVFGTAGEFELRKAIDQAMTQDPNFKGI